MKKITPINNKNLESLNVVIEIPMDGSPVKYEIDKDSGLLAVDRFLPVAMSYPCNYGFLPNTLGNDGDPLDILLITRYPVIPGSLVKSRAIGVLLMEDESGMDEKILAVPNEKLDVSYKYIRDISDLCARLKDRIVHFFEHYKDLEKEKWVKVKGWGNLDETKKIIKNSINN